MSHLCHAPGCRKRVPPKMLACREHWIALPQKIRDAVWNAYVPGQETTKRPTFKYMAVQRLALAHLAFKPDNEVAVLAAIPYLGDALRYAKMAVEAGERDPLEGLVPGEWELPK